MKLIPFDVNQTISKTQFVCATTDIVRLHSKDELKRGSKIISRVKIKDIWGKQIYFSSLSIV